MEKQSSDSPVCPKCNSTNVAKYLWGLRLLDDQLERDIEEGRVILGGCIYVEKTPGFIATIASTIGDSCSFEFCRYRQ